MHATAILPKCSEHISDNSTYWHIGRGIFIERLDKRVVSKLIVEKESVKKNKK